MILDIVILVLIVAVVTNPEGTARFIRNRIAAIRRGLNKD